MKAIKAPDRGKVRELDEILVEICQTLQLSPTQYAQAESHYNHVGRWLDESDAEMLANPDIQPQGSMRLKTTVKPIGSQEYDLDLLAICNVDPLTTFSHELYDKMLNRIREHDDLKRRLEPQNRCLRLTYANQFHLDVVPACRNPSGGIFVPDRALRSASRPLSSWKASDPIRYAEWFETRAATTEDQEYKRSTASVQPLKPQTANDELEPLRHVVQILKRIRDVEFYGKDDIPSSIFMTTLAGNAYTGSPSVSLSLWQIVDQIASHITRAAPARIVVPNPTNLAEDFASAMTAPAYRRFCAMILTLQDALNDLANVAGIPRISQLLESLLDRSSDSVVKNAIASRAVRTHVNHDAGKLVVSGPAAAIHVGGMSRPSLRETPIRRNTFLGE